VTPEELNAVRNAISLLEMLTRQPVAAPQQQYQAVQPAPSSTWVCPLHRTPGKIVPAGFSQRTQRPYNAFMACSTPGCNERPPRNAPAAGESRQDAPQGVGVASQPNPLRELP